MHAAPPVQSTSHVPVEFDEQFTSQLVPLPSHSAGIDPMLPMCCVPRASIVQLAPLTQRSRWLRSTRASIVQVVPLPVQVASHPSAQVNAHPQPLSQVQTEPPLHPVSMQSVQPPGQAHAPDEQSVSGNVHALPHMPQFASSLRTSVSHPFALMLSQSPQFGSHMPTAHVPVAHDSVARARVHPVPQLPQFDVVVSDVSQPSEVMPLQLPQPPLHVVSAHVPDAHDSPALGRLQPVPQVPQSESVVSEVSQPLVSTLSQLPNPAAHVTSAQLRVAHDSVAFGRLHATSQAPQSVSVSSRVSQPLERVPSQLPNAASHAVSVQVPVAHDSVAFARLQDVPHEPQFVSVFSGVSHPSARLPLQLAHPASHASTQEPLEQVGVAWLVLHALPQPPQWFGSVAVFAQLPEHRVSPLAQPLTQPVEGSQIGVPPVHRIPQALQFIVVDRSTSHPSDAVPLQSSYPGSQSMIWQEPVAQVSAARVSEHAVPQVPQSLIVRSDVSQPVSVAPSQSPKPAAHVVISHVPVAQLSVALASEHATPQPPQSVRLSVNTSQPFSGLPSQSA